jgi:hypothetical protein
MNTLISILSAIITLCACCVVIQQSQVITSLTLDVAQLKNDAYEWQVFRKQARHRFDDLDIELERYR